MKKQDLTGQKFNMLKVIEEDGKKSTQITWLCECDCGIRKVILGLHLKRGKIKSCGCHRKKINSEIHTKHGRNRVGKRTSEYITWANMIRRCSNPSDEFYSLYGGRGITVCENWKDFANFFADMGERPAGCSIERKDCDGNYCPENCVWADSIVQANNRSNNVVLEYQGRKQTAKQWSRELNIPYEALRQRLNRGWSTEEALGTPCRRK
jgi:hypothetical protein